MSLSRSVHYRRFYCLLFYHIRFVSSAIQKCLKEFHYDQEITLERILEDHLPPHLTAPSEDVSATPLDNRGGRGLPEAQLVDSRSNVFDYDEFDVLHGRDVDWDKVHVGKRCVYVEGACPFERGVSVENRAVRHVLTCNF